MPLRIPDALRVLQLAGSQTPTRRQLLQAAAVAPLTGRWVPHGLSQSPIRVAIIGAGIAGLNAADVLRRHGIQATVYEAASRVGGRIRTQSSPWSRGQWLELGGEFINSNHREMRRLAADLDLSLIDLVEAAGDRESVVFVNGRRYSEAEIARAYARIEPAIRRDAARLKLSAPDAFTLQMDRMTLDAYFDRIELTGWLREYLSVSYLTEYGAELNQQSALNFLAILAEETVSDGVLDVIQSDQRYKVRGGNAQIPIGLAARLTDQIRLGHRLVAVRPSGSGFTLTLDVQGGRTQEAGCDFCILAIPFSLLRQVDLTGLAIPPRQMQAIRELGYGTNAKLVLPYRERAWQKERLNGFYTSDLAIQTGWDTSLGQPGRSGLLTVYLGGKEGEALSQGTPESRRVRALLAIRQVFPGTRAHELPGQVRATWPSEPLSKGSYSCYAPGQWTRLGPVLAQPVGNLVFAGEHTSALFGGYMEGAAQSGRQAAELIARKVGAR